MILLALSCSSTSPSGTPSGLSGDTAPPPQCDAIRADWQGAYDALVGKHRACAVDEDCHAPSGGCPVELGGCQEAVNVDLSEGELQALVSDARAELEAAGCQVTVVACDCYGLDSAECDLGTCALVSGY
jgi:hypothetical protein